MHPVYRNLKFKDTLFGLELIDLVIMAILFNTIFRIHPTPSWAGKLTNLIIVGMVYLALAVFKRRLPKGFFTNLMNFYFKPRVFIPTRDDPLECVWKGEKDES